MYSYFYVAVCNYEGLVDISKEHASYKIGVCEVWHGGVPVAGRRYTTYRFSSKLIAKSTL